MPLNLPNLLTWLRILLIPIFLALYFLPDGWMSMSERNLGAALIFAVAAGTDWLDGYLARSLNQSSAFGAFLDPVADKLMVAAALILLVHLQRANVVVAVVIIGREITISALREWMARLGQSRSVAVSFIGKLKTACQMIAILLLLYDGRAPWLGNVRWAGTLFIYVAAVLTLWSMVYYLRRAAPDILRA